MTFENKKQLRTHIEKFCHVNNFLHESKFHPAKDFDVDAYVTKNIQKFDSLDSQEIEERRKNFMKDRFVVNGSRISRAGVEHNRFNKGSPKTIKREMKVSRLRLIDDKPSSQGLLNNGSRKLIQSLQKNDDSLSYEKLKMQNNNNISVMHDFINHTEKKLDYLRRSQMQKEVNSSSSHSNKENQQNRHNKDGRVEAMQDELDRLIRERELENRRLQEELAGSNQHPITNRNHFHQAQNFQPTESKFLELTDLSKGSQLLNDKQLGTIQRKNKQSRKLKPQYPHHIEKFQRRQFKYDDFIDENILGNYGRNPDLNIHERYLNFISTAEIDNMRILERAPQNTELYRFKLEQFKESSTSRSEIEKLIHEQYLREIKRRYDVVARDQDKMFENMNWVDEYRRKIIGDRVKLDLMPNFIYDYNDYINNGANMNQMGAGPGNGKGDDGQAAEFDENGNRKGYVGDDYMIRDKNAHRGYIPEEGFILFYDFEVKLNKQSIDKEIERHEQRLRIMVSLVNEGEILVPPFEVGRKDLADESLKTLWSILKDKTHFNNVFVNDETLILFELQIVGPFKEDYDTEKGAEGKQENELVLEENMNKKHSDAYGFKNNYKVDYGDGGQVHDDILADRKNKVFVSKDYNEKVLVNLTKFNANYEYNDIDHGYEVKREGDLKVIVIGWTQLDVFEISGDLKRGKWKCPFYKPPVDFSIRKDTVRRLKVEYGPWIFLRLSFPYGDKFLTVKSFNPKETAGQYFIPWFHLRAANFKPPIKMQPKDKLNLDNDSIDSKDSQDTKAREERDLGSEFELSDRSDSTFNQENEEARLPKGLKLTLHRVINHISKSHMKIGVALIEAKNIVNDDNGKPCLRNTTIHNPLILEADPNLQNNTHEDNFQFGNRVILYTHNLHPIRFIP